MKHTITEIADAYMAEHDGELPILILAHTDNPEESRIIQGKFRDKHVSNDQATFVNVMRLAMILYGFTHYEFVMKPTFNYTELQMTKDVFAVGVVNESEQTTSFFEVENDKLVPYYDTMPIGGFISQLLPSKSERQLSFEPKVEKQIRLYVENSTYNLPQKVEKEESVSGLDALLELYK